MTLTKLADYSRFEPSIPTVAALTDLLGRKPRLLIAEDDGELRWGLEQVFERMGYEVKALARGDELLDCVAFTMLLEDDREPDAIITDIRMPHFNGLAVVEGLRHAGLKTPVFVISAFGDDKMRDRVLGMGGTEFFAKPVNVDALAAEISQAIAAGIG